MVSGLPFFIGHHLCLLLSWVPTSSFFVFSFFSIPSLIFLLNFQYCSVSPLFFFSYLPLWLCFCVYYCFAYKYFDRVVIFFFLSLSLSSHFPFPPSTVMIFSLRVSLLRNLRRATCPGCEKEAVTQVALVEKQVVERRRIRRRGTNRIPSARVCLCFH